MKLLRFVVGLICATLLQALGLRFFSHFSLVIDPFLILVVYHSLDSTPAWSSIGGSVAGLAQDALSGGLYGLHGFANTLVGYASARLQQRLVIQQPAQVGLLFILAAAFQLAVLASLQFLLVSGAELPDLGTMTARMISSGVLGTALYVLARNSRDWGARWRARRSRRLKI
ncbi:MAG: rod shape-determining protein MreD [bacterium]|nr:rod shape-determining protein MreD [bacterium]